MREYRFISLPVSIAHIPGAMVLAMSVTSPAAAHSVEAPGPPAAAIARTFSRVAHGGQLDSFPIPLGPGDVLQVAVQPRGVDLRLTLVAPDGETLIESYRTFSGIRHRLIWIAAAGGTYASVSYTHLTLPTIYSV